MELWQLKEKHSQDVKSAFNDSGCKYFPNSGVVRKFNGKELFRILELMNHSTLDFDKCKCNHH